MENEQKKGIYKLNLDSDVFLGLKTDFNQILRRTLSNMESKHSDEAEITVNLKISTSSDMVPDFIAGNGMNREIVRPKFVHKVASIMKIQDKKTGQVSGDYELVWDEESCQFIMKAVDNGQITMDEVENGNVAESPEVPQLNAAKAQLGFGNDSDGSVIEADYREVDPENEESEQEENNGDSEEEVGYGYDEPEE